MYTDDLIDNLSIDRLSPDGKHKMSYVTGRKGVTIDGVMMTESVPFQVVYDKDAKCFRWNAIEKNSKGLTELVVYTSTLLKLILSKTDVDIEKFRIFVDFSETTESLNLKS